MSRVEDVGAISGASSIADEITRLSETIRSCERLCLLSGRSLTRFAIPVNDRDDAPLVFIPSVTRDLHGLGERRVDRHPTTSAQCIAALQRLLPVIRRFQLGIQESPNLAFHPIDRAALLAFDPERVHDAVRNVINDSLRPFGGAGDALARAALTSKSFGYLHPFTAVHVLRSIAPSTALFGSVWWRSLFSVSWFLNRRGGSLRGFPNTQATNSPGTVFLTSRCVDAVEIIYRVFQRRGDRFARLATLMRRLKKLQETRRKITDLAAKNLVNRDIFDHGYATQAANLCEDIRDCIQEIAADIGLPKVYETWRNDLEEVIRDWKGTDQDRHAEFLSAVVDTFIKANARHSSNERVKHVSADNVKIIEEIRKTVGRIHSSVDRCLHTYGENVIGPWKLNVNQRRDAEQKIPEWVCSQNHWDATWDAVAGRSAATKDDKRSVQDLAVAESHLQNLESHWRRNRDASERACRTIKAVEGYFKNIFDDLQHLSRSRRKETARRSRRDADLESFLTTLVNTSSHLQRVHHQLSKNAEVGARWAEILMNRHLTYASSGMMTQFDPSELAHSLRVVCRDPSRTRFEIIVNALRIVCAAQRPDGTWSCQQPFYWTETGNSASTLGIETAWAIVSTVNTLVRGPERFGASLQEVNAELRPVYDALDRFFRWLSSSMQSMPVPAALRRREPGRAAGESGTVREPVEPGPAANEPLLYGWCSDRVYEPGRIHAWVTALAIEFLVEFRELMQERINALLRAEFLSHRPGELKALTEVEPTDLDSEEPVISKLFELLREHKALEVREGPWLPSKPRDPDIKFWSAVFYGPPGTSKTFLTKAIAGELQWPLISLSPSDFLTRGEGYIESRSREIFRALSAGSRLVYFFDEIDELIRDRRQSNETTRNVFTFLTPSFLTKLQDLRDAAKKNEFIFVLGTNYFDRIDSAAKRSGRIDRAFAIVYPDTRSRAYIIIAELLKARSRFQEELQSFQDKVNKVVSAGGYAEQPRPFLDLLVGASGFISYLKLKELIKRAESLIAKSTDQQIVEFIGDLHKIYQGQMVEFKPELSIREYADRRGALDTGEIERLLEIIPNQPFPWRPESEPPIIPLETQLESLRDEVKDRDSEFVGKIVELGKKFAHRRISPTPPAVRRPARRRRGRSAAH
jgi:hypothetical protein